jgi:hypothetical protein
MAIEVIWGNIEQTTIHVVFTGEWNWYEFYACSGEISRLMEQTTQPVDVILDMQDSKPMPADIRTHLQRVDFFRRKTSLTIVMQDGISSQPLAERLNGTIQPGVLLYALNLNEAQAFLTRQLA